MPELASLTMAPVLGFEVAARCVAIIKALGVRDAHRVRDRRPAATTCQRASQKKKQETADLYPTKDIPYEIRYPLKTKGKQ